MVTGWLILVAALAAPALSAQSAPAAQKTATEFYMEYRAAFEKATKIEDLLPFMAAANRKQVESTSAAERPQFFELMKMFNVTNAKVLKEERTAAGATLTVVGLDMEKKKASGKIEVVREGGAWKLGKEQWGS
jgi:hypothetical protein